MKIYPCDSGMEKDKCIVCYGKKKCPYSRIVINGITRNDKKNNEK
jgi:hypothetical protein